ncbi:hypothetical protein ACO0SA_004304 [Hanseniaspora valbyensis]
MASSMILSATDTEQTETARLGTSSNPNSHPRSTNSNNDRNTATLEQENENGDRDVDGMGMISHNNAISNVIIGNDNDHDNDACDMEIGMGIGIGMGGLNRIFGLSGVHDPFASNSEEEEEVEKAKSNSIHGENALEEYRQKLQQRAFSDGLDEYNIDEGELELGFDMSNNDKNNIFNEQSKKDGLSIDLFLKKKQRHQPETQNILLPSDDEDKYNDNDEKKNDIHSFSPTKKHIFSFTQAFASSQKGDLENKSQRNKTDFNLKKSPRKTTSLVKRKRKICNENNALLSDTQSPTKRQRTLDFYSPKKKAFLSSSDFNFASERELNDKERDENEKIVEKSLNQVDLAVSISDRDSESGFIPASDSIKVTQNTQLLSKKKIILLEEKEEEEKEKENDDKKNKSLEQQIIMSPEASMGIDTRDENGLQEEYVSILEGEIIRSEREDEEDEEGFDTTESPYKPNIEIAKKNYEEDKTKLNISKEVVLNIGILKNEIKSIVFEDEKSDSVSITEESVPTKKQQKMKKNEFNEQKIVMAYYDQSLAWYPAITKLFFLEKKKEEEEEGYNDSLYVTSLSGDSKWECKKKDILIFDFKIGSKISFNSKSYTILDKKKENLEGNNTSNNNKNLKVNLIQDNSGDTHILIDENEESKKKKRKKSKKWIPLAQIYLTTENFTENDVNSLPNEKYIITNNTNNNNTNTRMKAKKLKGFVVSFSGMNSLEADEYKHKIIDNGGTYLEREVYELIHETKEEENGLKFVKKGFQSKNFIKKRVNNNINEINLRRSPRKKNKLNKKDYNESYNTEISTDISSDDDETDESDINIPILLIDSENLLIDKTTPKILQFLCLGWPILHFKFIDTILNDNITVCDYLMMKEKYTFIDKCSLLNNIFKKYMCKLEVIEDDSNKNKVIIERDIIRYILTICDNNSISDINKLLNTTQDSLRYDINKNSNTILTKLIGNNNNNNNKTIINSNNQYYYLINISKRLMRIPLDINSIDILKKLVVVHNSL